VVFIDSYFDLKSFDKPIKTYLTQKYYYNLVGGYLEQSEFFIKENRIEVLDDYKIIEGTKESQFYSVADLKSKNRYTGAKILAGFVFYLHTETQVYNRAVFTVMDVLAQLGGVFGLIQPI